MRVPRIVAALMALLLAATMSQAFLAPAEAAGKPKHDLVASGKEIGNTGKFLALGKVSTYPSKKIKVLRKVGKGAYKAYKRTKTDSKGKFRVGIDGPVGACFKVVVPGTSVYKKTQARVGCIVSV